MDIREENIFHRSYQTGLEPQELICEESISINRIMTHDAMIKWNISPHKLHHLSSSMILCNLITHHVIWFYRILTLLISPSLWQLSWPEASQQQHHRWPSCGQQFLNRAERVFDKFKNIIRNRFWMFQTKFPSPYIFLPFTLLYSVVTLFSLSDSRQFVQYHRVMSGKRYI